MARTVGIGLQDFEKIRRNDYFYVDKTDFIREWWKSGDDVTLITRPRRFGKTLNMSMTEQFFSLRYANRSDLFEGLSIWKDEEFRCLQGTYPVIKLSFANVKERSYPATKKRIGQLLTDLYSEYDFLSESDTMTASDRSYMHGVSASMDEVDATMALHRLCKFLYQYYGKKVIVLLDEYDTPMQEAWVNGYWDELATFIRSFFHATCKTNPYLERALLTGITRTSRESIFSDLNNLKIVTTTSEEYAFSFGFTEEEVNAALDECGLQAEHEIVKSWYDGFVFGSHQAIYNPWSVLNFLDTGKVGPYWANTSSNSLIGKLIQESSQEIKENFSELLAGGSIETYVDEQIVYNQLGQNEDAIWSLLLAAGYLRVKRCQTRKGARMESGFSENWNPLYELELTNFEVKLMFETMIRGWFAPTASNYNSFIQALLNDDKKAMNTYMNRVALATFSCFDTGNRPSEESEPERFYHGFVLGLMVDLRDRYVITSNRESGFGRYDVILEPRNPKDYAYILEFKVFDPDAEKTLEDTVQSALNQIAAKKYETMLEERGIAPERIRTYGFAFRGKKVRIG
ncbi:MAG: ATP-binding protein [Clostridiales bacterium]|nr:ATP-binding protein [Clostridiales bacterium]